MQEYTKNEIAVGLFLIAGVAGLGFLSVSVAGLDLLPGENTHVEARFASVGGLKSGAVVKIAGVPVGSVTSIELKDYAAEVKLAVRQDVLLPADTIASIRTEGLLGETYVLLRPGGSEKNLEEGSRIAQTEPAIDLIDLVVKYALSSSDDDDDKAADDPLGDL